MQTHAYMRALPRRPCASRARRAKKCMAASPDSSITHAHLGLGRMTPGRTHARQQAVGLPRPAGDMPAGRCKMTWPSRTVPQCATWPRVRRPQPQAKRLLHHALPRRYFMPIPDPASLTCPLTINKSSSSDKALYASMQLQASVLPARRRVRSTPRETGAQEGRPCMRLTRKEELAAAHPGAATRPHLPRRSARAQRRGMPGVSAAGHSPGAPAVPLVPGPQICSRPPIRLLHTSFNACWTVCFHDSTQYARAFGAAWRHRLLATAGT